MNGVVDNGYPAVQRVNIGMDADKLCTGVFVTPRLMLTAAHCLQAAGARRASGDGSLISLWVGGASLLEGVGPLRYATPPGFFARPDSAQDVAIVQFGSAIVSTAMELSPSPATKWMPVRLVGYGRSTLGDKASAGVKRLAWNEIDQILLGQLVLRWVSGSLPAQGMLLPGDSGAPLIDDQGRVIGIGNDRYIEKGFSIDHQDILISTYVDLSEPSIRDFLCAAAASWGERLPSIAPAPAPPPAPTPAPEISF